MLCVIERMDAPNDLKSQISDLKSLGEGISRHLQADSRLGKQPSEFRNHWTATSE